HLGLAAGLAILVIGGMGMAAPVQGGIGIYHILVTATLMLYSLTKEAGVAYALIVHTSQTMLVVLLGGISFILSMLKSRRKPAPESELNVMHGITR
ncbi:MAG: UPF0104 family protein, partial [Hymenobacteraceae bacterium]|nr:UPF0104 family protein [Hymenobacteraceae bacterium]MDX5396598.1 UPF0104 family protein [Hymenobacteraceae bacterium]MDX5512661.1 UPF0104 family protein [Hymenobacteraceae bacterium]